MGEHKMRTYAEIQLSEAEDHLAVAIRSLSELTHEGVCPGKELYRAKMETLRQAEELARQALALVWRAKNPQ